MFCFVNGQWWVDLFNEYIAYTKHTALHVTIIFVILFIVICAFSEENGFLQQGLVPLKEAFS